MATEDCELPSLAGVRKERCSLSVALQGAWGSFENNRQEWGGPVDTGPHGAGEVSMCALRGGSLGQRAIKDVTVGEQMELRVQTQGLSSDNYRG